jgi:hypothetical protein
MRHACLQLDKAASRAASDSKLAELLAAVEETISVNEFLLKFDALEIAITSIGRNRESMAHAAESLAGVFDRIIKANTTIPTAAVLEEVLQKPPAGAAFEAVMWHSGALLRMQMTNSSLRQRAGAGKSITSRACCRSEHGPPTVLPACLSDLSAFAIST